MQFLAVSQPFDCFNLAILGRADPRYARVDGLTVEEHGASAALPVSATKLAAHESQVLAQHIEQGTRRVRRHGIRLTVDGERDFLGHDSTYCVQSILLRPLRLQILPAAGWPQ